MSNAAPASCCFLQTCAGSLAGSRRWAPAPRQRLFLHVKYPRWGIHRETCCHTSPDTFQSRRVWWQIVLWARNSNQNFLCFFVRPLILNIICYGSQTLCICFNIHFIHSLSFRSSRCFCYFYLGCLIQLTSSLCVRAADGFISQVFTFKSSQASLT